LAFPELKIQERIQLPLVAGLACQVFGSKTPDDGWR
jgi:hypothetical protein